MCCSRSQGQDYRRTMTAFQPQIREPLRPFRLPSLLTMPSPSSVSLQLTCQAKAFVKYSVEKTSLKSVRNFTYAAEPNASVHSTSYRGKRGGRLRETFGAMQRWIGGLREQRGGRPVGPARADGFLHPVGHARTGSAHARIARETTAASRHRLATAPANKLVHQRHSAP